MQGCLLVKPNKKLHFFGRLPGY